MSTPRVDERHEGLSEATVHTDHAAADQSTATALLTQPDTRPQWPAQHQRRRRPGTAEEGHQPAPYAEVLHNEAGANCAAFITRAGAFMARYGITIER